MRVNYVQYIFEMINMQLFYISIFVIMVVIPLNAVCLFFGSSTVGLVVFTGGGAVLSLLSYWITSLLLKVLSE